MLPRRYNRVMPITWRALALSVALAAGAFTPAARGAGPDGKFDERGSSHFRLLQDVGFERYSGPRGARAFERAVLEALEAAYRQVGDAIAVRPRARVAVVIYDSAAFDERFGGIFGFRAAGFFDGSIHVRGAPRIDERLLRTLHHEYTHAALHSVSVDAFPAWLNEGLAEYFEALATGKRHLTLREHAYLSGAVAQGGWIPLQALGTRSFAHLGGDSASLAYLQSYATVEHLVRRHGMRKLRDLCKRVARSRNVSAALDRTYRMELSDLEAALLAELT